MVQPVVRPDLDRLAGEKGWVLLGPLDDVPVTLYDDGFVIAAVPWSGWDGGALKALAAHLDAHSGPVVALFNADDTAAATMAARLRDSMCSRTLSQPSLGT